MSSEVLADVQEDTAAARRIDKIPVAEEMSDSFLAYAMSVITSRAIPDVRDGLKPVQRRVLWSMLKMGVRPNSSYRKSARIVGDTMGRYHPHGDAAIYDTLVRMGQDFSLNVPMIEPQGNFGSLDDPPAASRYTECRLTEAAMTMLREADEETVDFRPTYDGEDEEPSVLPGAFPNLLVNGTTGIAVGMATKLWPHNLKEAGACIKYVLSKMPSTAKRRRKKIPVEDLLAIMSGPDFPGGGIVLADEGIKEAYLTGRGSVRVRAKLHIEPLTRTRQAIIVTELPYQIGPEDVVGRISKLVSEDKLEGVSGVSDLSDVEGLRLRIELKPNIAADSVLESLYNSTSLEASYPANNVVLVDGVPCTLGLQELCEHYINHRLEVIVRRTTYRVRKAEARLHIVEGLLKALTNIDDVVAIIRKSRNPDTAKASLIKKYKLSDIQATHILDMALRRLTSLERTKLNDEKKALEKAISNYRAILASPQKQRKIVGDELAVIVDEHGVDRQSEIVAADTVENMAVVTEESNGLLLGSARMVTLSSSGKLGVDGSGSGKRTTFGRHDLLVRQARAESDGVVSAVTSKGKVARMSVADMPEAYNRVRGDDANRVMKIRRGDSVAALTGTANLLMVLVTSKGSVKRVDTSELLSAASGSTAFPLDRGETVADGFIATDDQLFCAVTNDGYITRMPVGEVTKRKLNSAGVAGMTANKGSRVISAGVVTEDDVVSVTTSRGRHTTISVGDIPSRGRGTKGVKLAKLTEGEKIKSVAMGSPSDLAIQYVSLDRPDGIDPKPEMFIPEIKPRPGTLTKEKRSVHLIARKRAL